MKVIIMRCPYCSKGVVGAENVVVIVGEGPAHLECHEYHVMGERSYKNIYFPDLSKEELLEMKEMILTELNVRERSSAMNTNDVEFF